MNNSQTVTKLLPNNIQTIERIKALFDNHPHVLDITGQWLSLYHKRKQLKKQGKDYTWVEDRLSVLSNRRNRLINRLTSSYLYYYNTFGIDTTEDIIDGF